MKWPVVLMLAAGLALAGCGSGAKESAHYTTTPPTTVHVTTSGDLPNPSRLVTWPAAQRLLKSCRVRHLEQTHSGAITLRLRGGRTVTTHEPVLDEVFKILARLSGNCQPQTVAME